MTTQVSQIGPSVFAVARNEPAGARLLGSAFVVQSRFLVTAFHVVGGNDANLYVIAPKMASLNDYQDTTNQQVEMVPAVIQSANPIHDVCILALPEAHYVIPSYQLGSTDMVSVGSPVATLGYPHMDWGRLVLTRHDTVVGARILIANQGIKSRQIVLNIQARPGQSGGPVFSSGGVVVAMILGSYAPGGGSNLIVGGVDPSTLHQTTHAISAEYLSEMLGQ